MKYILLTLTMTVLLSCKTNYKQEAATSAPKLLKINQLNIPQGYYSIEELDFLPKSKNSEVRFPQDIDIHRIMNIEGVEDDLIYELLILINTDGKVDDAKIIRASTEWYHDHLIEDVIRWKFEVGEKEGNYVKYYIITKVTI